MLRGAWLRIQADVGKSLCHLAKLGWGAMASMASCLAVISCMAFPRCLFSSYSIRHSGARAERASPESSAKDGSIWLDSGLARLRSSGGDGRPGMTENQK